ncbi:MAG: hypothetical protein JSV40_13035 [Deltaproteobacteria bacterium]|nr:MAG: hypothetical protein JSV40_13035 [Deltaproteobacteria bacterium]
MKKMLSTLVLFSTLALTRCATPPAPVGYDVTMIKPTPAPQMVYSDESIRIRFAMSKTWYHGPEFGGLSIFGRWENYDGISFELENKTDKIMTIDWTMITVTDCTGASGNPVMHRGVEPRLCYGPKQPTVIGPKDILRDIIIPCYAIRIYPTGCYVYMLPSPLEVPEPEFGLYLPLKIGEDLYVYRFAFRAKKASR